MPGPNTSGKNFEDMVGQLFNGEDQESEEAEVEEVEEDADAEADDE